MDFILESRVPKGGGGGRGSSSSGKSSKSKSKSKTSKNKSKGGHIVAGGGGSGGGGGLGTLPVWARVLIIVLIVWFILFLIAFVYYLVQELKRKKQGQKFRFGHVVGHALLVSTGLWVPVFLYKKFAAHRKSKSGKNESGARGGVYAKIEEGRADDGSNRDSWYAGAAAGNTNSNPSESKYEPMGYAPYRSQSPVPPSAPSAASGSTTAPAPAPAPATGQAGAAAEYYLPQPPSNTAPPQHPPQYS
ncbi:uncharacterized protein LY79DRAFT_669616 [Colletotrichum navitas]|uniref:Uncharacterized protein n=1 Tax=Colletotrichum navitas TaxID=681940 RepID=A0AAD8V674_9PEZI|nr:uncharacterized protein LY79DRAFT_669616 [Colletotrichum navitas]KAK1590898.1 hypothetical protein LY79DRAFT_669616 [Colletotrichum navitas]